VQLPSVTLSKWYNNYIILKGGNMCANLIIPKVYIDQFDIFDTQKAIKLVKDSFENELAKNLNLSRVSAPLYVTKASGLNDNLNGVERPVSFEIAELPGQEIEIVQSLAKWKRLALKQYDFWTNNGLYTDMNAIRRDETLDNLHSTYVDQWDWEKIITKQQRTIDFIKDTVIKIVHALKATEYQLIGKYPQIKPVIDDEVFFITSQELLDMYPDLDAKAREHEISKLHNTVFILQIGNKLSNGLPHDSRAPDYDDWQLNGDLLVYYELLDCAIELSSMGIRVDSASLVSQLEKAGASERLQLPYHQMLLNDELPLTIGGGIGQSRICLVLLHKAHIGEVQVSLWPKETLAICKKNKIRLL